MAARDETYRNQRWLDIIFAVSCILMLVTIVWMFAKDHYREFKEVQRQGRDIEVALVERQAYNEAQKQHDALTAAEKKVEFEEDVFKASRTIPTKIKETEEAKEKLTRLEPLVSAARAQRDSLVSQYDKLVKDRGLGLSGRSRDALEAEIKAKDEEIKDFVGRKGGLADQERELGDLKRKIAENEREIAGYRAEWDEAKKQRDAIEREHTRLVRLAEQKKIGAGAKFRALPVLDAFASPYKIEQNIPTGLLINYNFKEVQRNDRCVTCHMYIGRAGFEKSDLRKLAEAPENYPKATTLKLSASEIAAYCNHPRLDLFVGSNSPHPIEKFACTVCHAGHGGAATFKFAFHFPDAGKTDGDKLEPYALKRARWETEHHWHESLHPDYLWDFPMIPARFQESACLKCHHQVVDLIRTDGREEAPKLLKGYRLVRDNGCFGCHEISGFKSGRAVGPDLRLEPDPALDELPALERSKLLADPNDPPGTLRKVGPNLRRIAEKTNIEWVRKWIRSPRDFRPDTRMPHFFGLTNNTPDKLSDHLDGKSELPEDQKGLPDAEIEAMAFYLFKESEGYLDKVRAVQQLTPAQWREEQEAYQAFLKIDERRRDNPQLIPPRPDPKLAADMPAGRLAKVAPAEREKLTKDQLIAVLEYFSKRDRQRTAAATLEKQPYPPPEAGNHQANADNGGKLFQTKGCVACHTHDAVKVYNAEGEQISAAEFGPNLSSLKDKLGNNQTKAEKWLYYWLTNPSDYHPRTLMPNPQLEPKDRIDIAAWLLSEKGYVSPPEEYKTLNVKLDAGAIKNLALVYLEKAMPTKELAATAAAEGIDDLSWFPRADADERILAKKPPAGSPYEKWSHDDRLKYYAGRKSIGRYGCFACHYVPGFSAAKPIGTPLNDWGRKEPDRLAFEQIHNFITDHYDVPGHGHHADKEHYPSFFLHAIEGHRRDGFLFQKLKDPRSYDYQKIRGWEDRLKMPQFKFAHTKKRQNESDEDFAKRAREEEQEAAEAVMTFILGLVAEPVPMKFVNQPQPDRLNEVKGVKLLEKYNCVGCHITKPGSYEVPLDAQYAEGQTMLQQLQGNLDNETNKEALARDPVFPEHNAWVNRQNYPAGKVVVKGIPFIRQQAPAEDEIQTKPIELYEALRFPDAKTREPRQYPAGMQQLQVPMNSAWQQHPPTGGRFAEVLVRILAQTANKDPVLDRKELLGAVPPPLIREGQKAQAQWLLEFLRHPHEIRPSVGRNLRMPKFSLSHEETQALVNYFIAVDRLQNPAIGLDYASPLPSQRDPAEQERLREEFKYLVNRLAPDQARRADYWETGWKMLTDNNLCRKCHDLGKLKAEGKPEEKGPPLNMVADRLRPEYIERWISNPPRFLPYTFMPQYDPFYAQADYHGMVNALLKPNVKAAVQITPRLLATDPFGQLWPLNDRLYNQILSEFALTPAEKTRLIRDVLITWGYLADPPPTAVQAGPRGDMHGNGRLNHGGH